MLQSVKSKTILLTFSVLFVLSTVFSAYLLLDFNADKMFIVRNTDFTVTTLAEKINKEISTLERQAYDLSMFGSAFYNNSKSLDLLNMVTLKFFENNKYSVGGGLWFEPYAVKPDKKAFYTFVYPDKNGKMILDNDYNNYLEQDWYHEISTKSPKNSVVWSTPYFDSEGSKILMVTAGAAVYDKNKKFVGVSSIDWKLDSIADTVSKMRPTPNSFVIFADKKNDFIILDTCKDENSHMGASLKSVEWYSNDLQDKQTITYHKQKYISFVKNLDNGMLLIANVPEHELFHKLIMYIMFICIAILLTYIAVSTGIYMVLKENINKPIDKLINFAQKIGNGDLEAKTDLNKPKEFAELASTFNKMTTDIKTYMTNLNHVTKEKEKIESELSIAKKIQYSVLPSDYFENTKEFDIYATMDTAKEVGGDFFDFFFISPNKFAFLIADVSGKGIPAALFMMTTKTLIKNVAKEDLSPKEFIEKVNRLVCENNKQNYFVTMFTMFVDIETGAISFINCGHNPPLIKRIDGKYEYLKVNSNIVLGVFPDFEYNIEESNLNYGDIIFMYTDGVTEALNDKQELYGEKRLEDSLNSDKNTDEHDVKQVIANVKEDVSSFVNGNEQSDDLTTLAFKYNESSSTKTKANIVLPAQVEKFAEFSQWLEATCESMEIDNAYSMKLLLVSEEIFVNVASYAYPNDGGNIEVIIENSPQDVVMRFYDSGLQYNPLEKNDPDITLSAEERPIGGLGIFMMKKLVDFISYEYSNNKNVLSVKILKK